MKVASFSYAVLAGIALLALTACDDLRALRDRVLTFPGAGKGSHVQLIKDEPRPDPGFDPLTGPGWSLPNVPKKNEKKK
jgi:hypothetical protein